jgi:transposase-like protein
MPTSRPTTPVPGRKPRKRLAPSEKYEIFVQVLTSQATQREAADKFGVDRSAVVHICRTAKQGALDALSASVPGRPGQSLRSHRKLAHRGSRLDRVYVSESTVLRVFGRCSDDLHALVSRDSGRVMCSHGRWGRASSPLTWDNGRLTAAGHGPDNDIPSNSIRITRH